MNTHPEELLSGYLDDELSAEQSREVEKHITSCESCRDLLETLKTIKSTSSPELLSPDQIEIFVQENRGRREKRARRMRPMPHAKTAGLSALVAAMVIVAIAVFVALGGPMRSMFEAAVGTETMGQNQAALSGGIY